MSRREWLWLRMCSSLCDHLFSKLVIIVLSDLCTEYANNIALPSDFRLWLPSISNFSHACCLFVSCLLWNDCFCLLHFLLGYFPFLLSFFTYSGYFLLVCVANMSFKFVAYLPSFFMAYFGWIEMLNF